MKDETTKAAVERLRGMRLEAASTFDQDVITEVLNSLELAEARAERAEDALSQLTHYASDCGRDAKACVCDSCQIVRILMQATPGDFQ